MLDQILSIALLFTKQEIIIPVTIVGFYFIHPQVFIRTLIALLGSMVVVFCLKSCFQVPLKPHLGPGYAFPSGHMFSATVFWVTLSWELRYKLLSLLTGVLLALIAIGLVHFNYHDSIDVLAGLGFGLVFVGFHIVVQRTLKLSEAAYGLFMLGLCALLVLFQKYGPNHLYLAMGALAGLAMASLLFTDVPTKLWQQLAGVLGCFLLAFGALKGGPYLIHKGGHVATFVQYMVMGLSLRFSAHLTSRL